MNIQIASCTAGHVHVIWLLLRVRSLTRKGIFRRAANIRAFSSGGERFPDTEEVASSNLATPTIKDEVTIHAYRDPFI